MTILKRQGFLAGNVATPSERSGDDKEEIWLMTVSRFVSIGRQEIARLLNWAKEQNLGIVERPSVRVLLTIGRMKVWHERDEQIDVVNRQ